MKDQLTDKVSANEGKFQDKFLTAKGEARASVKLSNPETLWFNTGTLCNIECANCYILSSPTNDALVYLTADEVGEYLDQIEQRNWPVREIGFTGGEPFMNPEMVEMAHRCLARGFEVLILTNAMRPMMRKTMQAGLRGLINEYGDKLTFRISVDHWLETRHDQERGAGSFARTVEGMEWLRDQGAKLAIAARSVWGETDTQARAAYAEFFLKHKFNINAQNPAETVIFPEMDETIEVPEITTSCWGILDKSPQAVMCSSSRMVVKRKGADKPSVLACTLLPYHPEFEMGTTLHEAEADVHLNHPHCAKFCVLGGASCSA